jgi:hypothetical protein
MASIFRVDVKIKYAGEETEQSYRNCSHCLFASVLSYFSFFPEDGGDTFLLKVG